MALHWLMLVAAIWLQSINGTNSNFPAYSSELKRILSISQLQLNNLASASDAGKLLGWISGVAAAHLPLWLVLLIGSLLGIIGYGVQFLFLSHQIPSLSYWHIFLLTALAGNSICWINTVCYIIAINYFPLDRQIAIGLSTSYIGLSAEIYTDMVDAVSTSPSTRAKLFLLLNAVVPLLVSVACTPLARDVHVGKTRKLTRGFSTMFIVTIATGLFAVFTSLGGAVSGFLHRYTILGGMVAMLLLPFIVPLAEKIRETMEQKCWIRVHDVEAVGATTTDSAAKDLDVITPESVGVVEEVGPKVMLRRVEFWLYYFVYLFGVTLGLVYVNNLAQIAESRGFSATSSLVSFSSAFSFFGRLLPSLLHFFFPRSKYLISRGGGMGGMMIPMCAAFFMLLSGSHISLYMSTSVISICTGAITSISVSTTTELFGAKNFGVNHNILVSNIPIGSFLFGDFAAVLYNRGRNRVLGDHDQGNCVGQNCYQTTFIIWGCLCALGTLLAFILHARTKKS